jgi:hypothetical protein
MESLGLLADLQDGVHTHCWRVRLKDPACDLPWDLCLTESPACEVLPIPVTCLQYASVRHTWNPWQTAVATSVPPLYLLHCNA